MENSKMNKQKLEAINYLYDAIYWASSRMEEFRDDDHRFDEVEKTLNKAIEQLRDFYDSKGLEPSYYIFNSVRDYNARFRNFK